MWQTFDFDDCIVGCKEGFVHYSKEISCAPGALYGYWNGDKSTTTRNVAKSDATFALTGWRPGDHLLQARSSVLHEGGPWRLTLWLRSASTPVCYYRLCAMLWMWLLRQAPRCVTLEVSLWLHTCRSDMQQMASRWSLQRSRPYHGQDGSGEYLRGWVLNSRNAPSPRET
jgi:hypothetical protein